MLPKEVIPATAVKRCPKCGKTTMMFDAENKRLVCSACGYEARLQS